MVVKFLIIDGLGHVMYSHSAWAQCMDTVRGHSASTQCMDTVHGLAYARREWIVIRIIIEDVPPGWRIHGCWACSVAIARLVFSIHFDHMISHVVDIVDFKCPSSQRTRYYIYIFFLSIQCKIDNKKHIAAIMLVEFLLILFYSFAFLRFVLFFNGN